MAASFWCSIRAGWIENLFECPKACLVAFLEARTVPTLLGAGWIGKSRPNVRLGLVPLGMLIEVDV